MGTRCDTIAFFHAEVGGCDAGRLFKHNELKDEFQF